MYTACSFTIAGLLINHNLQTVKISTHISVPKYPRVNCTETLTKNSLELLKRAHAARQSGIKNTVKMTGKNKGWYHSVPKWIDRGKDVAKWSGKATQARADK